MHLSKRDRSILSAQVLHSSYVPLSRRLENFPPPREGEIVLGIESRLFHYLYQWDSRKFRQYLLGHETSEFDPRYVTGLNHMHKKLSWFWRSPAGLIEAHTLFPLFRAFLPNRKEADRLVETMLQKKRAPGRYFRRLFALDGVTTKRFSARYCLGCLLDDLKCGWAPTWYRRHQIPGIDWCVIHRCRVVTKCVRCSQKVFRRSYALPWHHCGCRSYWTAAPFSDRPSREEFDRTEFIKEIVGYVQAAPLVNAKTADDFAEMRVASFAVGLLDQRLQPLEPQQWADASRLIIETKGVGAIYSTANEMISTGLWRRVWGNDVEELETLFEEKRFSSLTLMQRLCLLATFFDSAEEFVATLRSVHDKRIFVSVDPTPNRAI